MPQQLAPKEAAQFRTIIRSYEDKQYKRGLKTADLILKKNPKHGETMAMKALILNSQGKTEEAFNLGKDALTADMKSHICWHVYGLLYRAAKNFEEAIKAYKFALKIEPESPQIQRDLATLQVQMRDYQGYVQSRTAMLKARPQIRQSWTGLAVAHHLAGNPSEAENVLTTYEGTLKTSPSRHDLEHSEAIMYKNSLIVEQGDYGRALDHLQDAAKLNLDRLAVLETHAELLSKLDRKDEAAKAYRALLDRNPDHFVYYDGLIAALEIPESDASARKAVFDHYVEASPRCDAARRIPLDFLTGDQFEDAAAKYLAFMLNKGVPSTFANLKHLYADASKKKALAALTEAYLKSQTADSSSKDKGAAAALYFMAQHYDYHLSRDLEKAMDFINQAIEKDSKSVDFHMTKARILKHQGYLDKAAEVMDYARTLDLKDRYINSKAAKYQLRNNETDKALKTMGKFTRAETVGGPLADLLDMQCIWFLTEDGESYARQGNIGMALKRFHAVGDIFDVWHEDQFDFHTFSLRRGHIRAYLDMIKWEDNVRDHPFFSRAALDAISIYIKMADRISSNGANGASDENGEDSLAKKKAAKKAKREQQRLEREAEEKQAKQDPNKSSVTGEPKKKDDDPQGLKLAAAEDPLAVAMKFLDPLLQASPENVEAQIAGFEVFSRRRKYVRALRCLRAAVAVNAEHPKVHEQLVAFRLLLRNTTEVPPSIKKVLESEYESVGAPQDLANYNQEYRNRHQKSSAHQLAAIKVDRQLGHDFAGCESHAFELLKSAETTSTDAIEILETLKLWGSSKVTAYKEAALAKWPGVTRLV